MPTEGQLCACNTQGEDRFSRRIWSTRQSCIEPTIDIHLPQRKRKSRENGCLLTKKRDGWVGAETQRNRACLDAGRQKELSRALQKSVVLSQSGDETQEGSQGVAVWPRVLDGAIQPNEHRISETGQKQFWEELLQPHVQFRIWENNGECAEASSQHNCLRRWKRKDLQTHSESPFRRLHTIFLVSFRMHKECVKLDKSFYAGMVILDISKILMYDF